MLVIVEMGMGRQLWYVW